MAMSIIEAAGNCTAVIVASCLFIQHEKEIRANRQPKTLEKIFSHRMKGKDQRKRTKKRVYIIAYTILTDPQKMLFDISSSALTTKGKLVGE